LGNNFIHTKKWRINMDFETLLLNGGREFGIELDRKKIERFKIYKELLISWNKKINLTSIIEDNDIAIKHFVDSISVIQFIERKDVKLIDIGTGGGFPGIPCKIILEDSNVVLLDSLKKRVEFLKKVIDQIGVNGINCIHGRAEDFGREENYREKFNIVTARAVASLPILLEYCLPFLEINGKFIAMKGSSIEEIKESSNALKLLGGEIIDIKEFRLPYSKDKRNVIIIQKQRQTPTKFPRKAGKPSSNPLF